MCINNSRHRPLHIPFDFVIFTLNANIAGDLEYCLFYFHLFLLPSRKASSNTHYDRTVTPCWDPVHFYMMLFLRGCSEHGRASNCYSYYIFDNARKMLGLFAVDYNRKRFAYSKPQTLSIVELSQELNSVSEVSFSLCR